MVDTGLRAIPFGPGTRRETLTVPVIPATPCILVVDESRSIRELLRLHLGNAGYQVITAEDAIVAGRQVLLQAPHLMIVDLQLPYLSGADFIGAMKADRTVPPIPVIFLSSHGDVEQHARRLGAVAHFSKPVAADRLLQAVALHAGSAAS